ncbi:hypothetical protein LYNGBM3L_58940 [Moorena producens 3L]|uniref:Uncharacterized protein n=1 Tax=Moorena producens 3L TaxID=489825 RepID=F4XZU2_9CYAN|nr:hypothetical protein LYNGBM3L_58940 [Moorena producens 3L]
MAKRARVAVRVAWPKGQKAKAKACAKKHLKQLEPLAHG